MRLPRRQRQPQAATRSQIGLVQVAEGAEAGRRAAWAKFYEAEERLALCRCGAAEGEYPPPDPRWLWMLALRDAEATEADEGRRLTPLAKLVGLTMAQFALPDLAGTVWVSVSTVAALTGLSVRTVKRHRKILVDLGWLVLVERGGAPPGGKRTSNAYRFADPTPREPS